MICARRLTSVLNVVSGAANGCTGSKIPTNMPRAALASLGLAVAARPQRTIVIRAMQIRLDPKWLPSEARQHPPEPLFELDFRLPAEHLPGSGDVGLANLRIVHGQGLVDDLTLRRCDPDNCLCELENRKLPRVADVDRQVLAAL